jgi:hypothetical protein
VEVVGAGVRLADADFAGDDVVEAGADLFDALDLDPGEGDAVGEFLDGEIGDVDVVGEPAYGEFHARNP